jgi:predicted GNAT superfamily acetyltransferase
MDGYALRHATVGDLAMVLAEMPDFWGERDMTHLHHALYVHEFGETSVVLERDGRIAAYLLGFVNQQRAGYIHVVAVHSHARGQGLGRVLYERFEQLVRARGASALKAITRPGNGGSRAFHAALGFSEHEVPSYTSSGEPRMVFWRELD